MLDRGWRVQCAELRGEEIADEPAATSSCRDRRALHAVTRSPRSRTFRCVPARARRQVQGVQDTDIDPLPDRGNPGGALAVAAIVTFGATPKAPRHAFCCGRCWRGQ
jgi:hypothetical protein